MILLFTDFGPYGPYLGQVRAVLLERAPTVPVIDLLSNAPAFNARASSYLLASLAPEFPAGTVFLGVVDPGVGCEARLPVVVEARGQRFVGPDNGLFEMVARADADARWWRIIWTPQRLSDTFHGRDLFAPVAAMLAAGEPIPGQPMVRPQPDCDVWPEDLWEVIYVDCFGNAITGIRAQEAAKAGALSVKGRSIPKGRTYGDRERGEAFWYPNSNGLAEIAVSQGAAARELGLAVGTAVQPA